MKNFKDIPLLITAAVHPIANVKIQNPEQRLMQYKSSIYRWATETSFRKLVIVDNTNTKILSQPEVDHLTDYGVEVEQICTIANPEVRLRGTSFGISEIYETAISESRLIDESTHFAKITGRLFVENTGDLLSKIDEHSSYLIRWLSKGLFRFKPGRFDERFAIYNKKFYIDELLPLKSEMDDSKDRWIEIVYNEKLENHKNLIRDFNVYPRIVGISGHYGKPYDGNVFLRWKTKDLFNKYLKVLRY